MPMGRRCKWRSIIIITFLSTEYLLSLVEVSDLGIQEKVDYKTGSWFLPRLCPLHEKKLQGNSVAKKKSNVFVHLTLFELFPVGACICQSSNKG